MNVDGQANVNFKRIAEAIAYIKSNFKLQPELDEVAHNVHLSPFHLQRMFTDWAGVSPKKFLQYTTIEYAKNLLNKNRSSLFDVAYESGLSGTGRLHDLFVSIEAMTPGEFKKGGASLQICYSFQLTDFGTILVASTTKGICHISFADDPDVAITDLQSHFPNAIYRQASDPAHINVLQLFSLDWSSAEMVKLHLKGSPFQIKVWEALLKIPYGHLVSYRSIARHLNSENASRAVGSAVGSNPIAFLIPCHRVIQSSGVLGQYHWGASRKMAMVGFEAVHNNLKEEGEGRREVEKGFTY